MPLITSRLKVKLTGESLSRTRIARARKPKSTAAAKGSKPGSRC